MEDLKKEFFEKYFSEEDTPIDPEEIFQWINERLVPKSDLLKLSKEISDQQLKIAELQAENEKLSLLLNDNTIKWHTAELKLQKARTEERARIVNLVKETIKKSEEYYKDRSDADKLIIVGEQNILFVLEQEAITADQPTQQSCEGCEQPKEHYKSSPTDVVCLRKEK